jgi:serine/threonine protein kinase
VTDVVRLPDGVPFLVMEYLEGSDLSKVSKTSDRLPIDEVVEYVLQACDAVAVAHSLGIVHRDLKPANLFLTRRVDGTPCVKVLDFGISKVLEGPISDAPLTITTGVVGSPMYMSPEQMASSRNVDARTDIWALGMILFKMLTGKAPYQAESLLDLATKIANDPPLRPRALRPEIPEALEAAVMRCLEKDRDRRFGSVAELAVALVDFAPPRTRPLVQRIERIALSSGNEPFSLQQGLTGDDLETAETTGDRTGVPSAVTIAPGQVAAPTLPQPSVTVEAKTLDTGTDRTPHDDTLARAQRRRTAMMIGIGAVCSLPIAVLILLAAGRRRGPDPVAPPHDEPRPTIEAPAAAAKTEEARPTLSASAPTAPAALHVASTMIPSKTPAPPKPVVATAEPKPAEPKIAPKAIPKNPPAGSAGKGELWGWE